MSFTATEIFVEGSKIVESFSKHAKTYDRRAFLQKNMAETLASLIPEKNINNILEIGCGTGLFTRHLIALSPKHITLNDISSAMMDCLTTQIDLPETVKTLIGDAEKIEFPKVFKLFFYIFMRG